MIQSVDLFSGIGGMALGFERAGIQTSAFCEIDSFSKKVLKKHWPEVPQYEDVRALTASRLAADGIRCDILCGGFPCQPYSVAGLGRGAADSRDLLPEFLRLVREIKPAWVVGENTEGFVGRGLDACVDALEAQGYALWCASIPACVVGLSSMERHLWIVATTSSERLERFRKISLSRLERGTRQFQGSHPRGLDLWHLSAARVCRVGERIPNRVDRLKSLGNAVDPRVPEMFGRSMIEAMTP